MKKLLIIILIIILFTGCNKEENKPIKENYKNVIEEQEKEGILLSNINLINNDDSMIFSAILTNKNDKDIKMNSFTILLKDNSNNTIQIIEGYIGDNLKRGESKDFITNIDQKVEGVSKIELII